MVETGRSERRGEAWRSPAWRCEARRSAAWQGILFEIRKGGRGIMVGKKQEEETITLDEVRWKTIILKAKGITPYIPHRKSTRARKQMEAKQSKKVIEQAARNFDLEYEECFYLLPGGVRTVEGVPAEGEEDGRRRKYGTPAAAFKKAILDTAPMLKGIHKTAIGRSIQIVTMDGFIPIIEYQTIVRIGDVVRIGRGVDMPVHRPYFFKPVWELTLRFNEAEFSAEQVVKLLQLAGLGQGVGDWRPGSPKNRSGNKGLFAVGAQGKASQGGASQSGA